jgi:hypothetical protein
MKIMQLNFKACVLIMPDFYYFRFSVLYKVIKNYPMWGTHLSICDLVSMLNCQIFLNLTLRPSPKFVKKFWFLVMLICNKDKAKNGLFHVSH